MATKDKAAEARAEIREEVGKTAELQDRRDEHVDNLAVKAAVVEMQEDARGLAPKAPPKGSDLANFQEMDPAAAGTAKYAHELRQVEENRQPNPTPEQLAVEEMAREFKAKEAALQAKGFAEMEGHADRDPRDLFGRAAGGEHVRITADERDRMLERPDADSGVNAAGFTSEEISELRGFVRRNDLYVAGR